MKKLYISVGLICCLCTFAVAQQGQGDDQQPGVRLEALKIAYITKKLNLSTEEAQKFWPIYNQYAAELKQVRQANRVDRNEIQLEEQLLAVRKKYNGEFSKALSPEKVNQFFHSEKEFGNFIQKELMDRKQMRMQQQRRPFRQ